MHECASTRRVYIHICIEFQVNTKDERRFYFPYKDNVDFRSRNWFYSSTPSFSFSFTFEMGRLIT